MDHNKRPSRTTNMLAKAMTVEAPISNVPSSPDHFICGKFLPIEFIVYGIVFIAGIAGNALFIMASKGKWVNPRGSSLKPNTHLVHCAVANTILLLLMPLDVSYTKYRSWFWGVHLCRLHPFIERTMNFAVVTHIIYMARDAYKPFGLPNHPSQMTTNWTVSLVLMSPLLFTKLVQTPGLCTQCVLLENNLGNTPIFQWSELLYVAALPLISVWFYSNKYSVHPDYNHTAKRPGLDEDSTSTKFQLRSLSLALAINMCVCTSPARLTEIVGGDFKQWPGNQILFVLIPRLLIYGQTIIFTVVCALSQPTLYKQVKIVAARCRRLPEKFLAEEEA